MSKTFIIIIYKIMHLILHSKLLNRNMHWLNHKQTAHLINKFVCILMHQHTQSSK
jgi:hypothetical protein